VAAVLAIFLEFRGMRVRTASELSYWGGGPVVGSTRWPHDPAGVTALGEELDDFLPNSRGWMLVVASTDSERALANELARRLNDEWVPGDLVDFEVYAPEMGRVLAETAEPATELASSTALSRRGPMADALMYPGPLRAPLADSWHGPLGVPALRRAARLADRVLVVVTSGSMSALEIARIRTRIGRSEGVGFVLVGIDSDLDELPDRIGPVDAFWRTHRA